MKIALLHYTYGPVVGGVETILEEHAGLFAAHGHEVTVICGEGKSGNPAIQVALIPEMRRDHPLAKAAQGELDSGAPGAKFAELKKRLAETLAPLLENKEIFFLHNVLTMHFHLPLTAALWEMAESVRAVRFVAWIHDLAACNPDYPFPHLDREPWNLITRHHPRVEYAAVSAHRKKQFAALAGIPSESCRVVPNGIDPAAQLGLTENVANFVNERGILEKEIVLLHPARILKRKNIELGIRVIAEMKTAGKSCYCIVTGAPDFHNPEAVNYHESLLKLRAELGLADEFVFLHELFTVTNRDLIGLYRVADALFLPSKQEGFGLPILEGALHRIPIFCADIEPMKSLAHHHITFFSPEIAPGALASTIQKYVAASPAIQAAKAVVRDYSWRRIYPLHLEPLLKNQSHSL
jgi:glycosyltransferase involved in cell wall biosynthesis